MCPINLYFSDLSKTTTKSICVGTKSSGTRMVVMEAHTCNTNGWKHHLNFYTPHLLVPEAEAFWVGFVTNPWKYAIFEEESHQEYPTGSKTSMQFFNNRLFPCISS